MELTVLDRSNYFRGLLLLAAKDKILSESEIDIMKGVGASLGFDKRFSEESIRDLLENEHISNTPPVFSNEEISKRFIMDGIKLALSDDNIAPEEIKWLRRVAAANKLSKNWLADQLKDFVEKETYKSKLDIISIASVFI